MASPNVRVSPNRWSVTKPSDQLSFGHRQEAMIRRGLESNPDFEVKASMRLDHLHKLDLVIKDKTRDELGPVGLQITLRDDDPVKMERTFQALKKDQPVARAIYLITDPVIPQTIPVLAQVIREVAAWPWQGMAVIRLQHTSEGIRARLLKRMTFGAQARVAWMSTNVTRNPGWSHTSV